MYKKLQNTFKVQTFNSCAINNAGIEKENFCTNFLICHCLATKWNHQKQWQTEKADRYLS